MSAQSIRRIRRSVGGIHHQTSVMSAGSAARRRRLRNGGAQTAHTACWLKPGGGPALYGDNLRAKQLMLPSALLVAAACWRRSNRRRLQWRQPAAQRKLNLQGMAAYFIKNGRTNGTVDQSSTISGRSGSFQTAQNMPQPTIPSPSLLPSLPTPLPPLPSTKSRLTKIKIPVLEIPEGNWKEIPLFQEGNYWKDIQKDSIWKDIPKIEGWYKLLAGRVNEK